VSDAAVGGDDDDGNAVSATVKRALCLTSHHRATQFIYFPVMSSLIPHGASSAVLKQSEPVSDEAVAVQGPNFDERPTLETLLDSYERIGFQANSLGKAINIVNKMVGAPL
jgi:Deoxyhypusine synthase